jgi:hypothetical protein
MPECLALLPRPRSRTRGLICACLRWRHGAGFCACVRVRVYACVCVCALECMLMRWYPWRSALRPGEGCEADRAVISVRTGCAVCEWLSGPAVARGRAMCMPSSAPTGARPSGDGMGRLLCVIAW